jgi:hypothetical protein
VFETVHHDSAYDFKTALEVLAKVAVVVRFPKSFEGSIFCSSNRLLKNSFPPQFDSVLDSVGFHCVYGFGPAQRTFSAASETQCQRS